MKKFNYHSPEEHGSRVLTAKAEPTNGKVDLYREGADETGEPVLVLDIGSCTIGTAVGQCSPVIEKAAKAEKPEDETNKKK